ncbi:MAG: C1 family peptidase [Planctomycetes bacterium]|nr:C1 family peptidase [Planctomycetota bacterium]
MTRVALASFTTALTLLGPASGQEAAARSEPPAIDWRDAQSPVKNQGHRGTCAAFAICGALETFPGIPGDLSEQLLYATVKLHQKEVVQWSRTLGVEAKIGEGDLFDVYAPLFELIGTCCESFLPYDPDPKRAGDSVPDELKRYLELAHVAPADLETLRDGFGKYGFAASDCTVLDAATVRDAEHLKALLAAGNVAIPVGYAVYGPTWSKIGEHGNHAGDGKRVIVHPGMMFRFARAGEEAKSYADALVDCAQRGESFVDAVRSGELVTSKLGADDEYGGHAVILCGYDERGFLAKNSWGAEWGDRGYFVVGWDYHALYAAQGLVIAGARIRNPALSPFETRSRIEQGRFRTKLRPRGAGDGAQWQLSVWMEEPRDANWEMAEYRVDVRGESGDWREVARAIVHGGAVDARTGAPWTIDGDAFAAIRASESVRVTVRIGDLPLGDLSKPDETRWLRTLEFEPFAPALDGAIDLVPRR